MLVSFEFLCTTDTMCSITYNLLVVKLIIFIVVQINADLNAKTNSFGSFVPSNATISAGETKLINTPFTLPKGKYLILSSSTQGQASVNYRLRVGGSDKLFVSGVCCFNGVFEKNTDSTTIEIYCTNWSSSAVTLNFDSAYCKQYWVKLL